MCSNHIVFNIELERVPQKYGTPHTYRMFGTVPPLNVLPDKREREREKKISPYFAVNNEC